MGRIVPAVLPTSRRELEEELVMLARISSVTRVQIDVVDGRFAAPASWPYTAVGELQQMAKKGNMFGSFGPIEYEIDLMCLDAFTAAEMWLDLGASRLTFHAESTTDLPRQLAFARERYCGGLTTGLGAFGVALNIASDLAILEPCLEEINYVQFMGIAHIGRQGQPFDRRVYEKIRIFHERHPEIPIQVDGGVSLHNVQHLVALGVSNLVIGSAIVGAKNPASAAHELEALAAPH